MEMPEKDEKYIQHFSLKIWTGKITLDTRRNLHEGGTPVQLNFPKNCNKHCAYTEYFGLM
jgi:hypothetical protein